MTATPGASEKLVQALPLPSPIGAMQFFAILGAEAALNLHHQARRGSVSPRQLAITLALKDSPSAAREAAAMWAEAHASHCLMVAWQPSMDELLTAFLDGAIQRTWVRGQAGLLLVHPLRTTIASWHFTPLPRL